jgi:hypothetical protein
MQIKILDIKRTNRTSKAGRPFVSLSLKTEQYGDRWVSGFGGPENEKWAIGDTVEVEIETKGDFLNFKTIKMNPVQGDTSRVMNFLEYKVMAALQFMQEDIKAIRKELLKEGVEYPEHSESNDAHNIDLDAIDLSEEPEF